MTLSAHDHDMIHHAKHRGVVLVTHQGRTQLATLIAWRKQRHGCHTQYARVQYGPGRFASVKIDQITLPEGVLIHER